MTYLSFSGLSAGAKAGIIAALITAVAALAAILLLFISKGRKRGRAPSFRAQQEAGKDKGFVYDWSVVERLVITKCLYSGSFEVRVPEGVSGIERKAFEGCDMQQLYLPESLRTVGQRAFAECGRLRYVRLPKNVENVGSHAFEGCSSMIRAEFPYSAYVEPSAFGGCDELRALVISGHEFKLSEDGYSDDFFKDVTAVFAGEGDQKALGYVSKHGYDMLESFISRDRLEQLRLLLGCSAGLSAADIDKALDLCAAQDKREMFLMLVQYKRDRLGFVTDSGAGARFGL